MRGVTALLKDDDGQDLLEYALLAAIVAIASVAAVNVLRETLQETYVRWDTDMQALADMPNPGA
jgi:Flp pilus assembly pilin Flp